MIKNPTNICQIFLWIIHVERLLSLEVFLSWQKFIFVNKYPSFPQDMREEDMAKDSHIRLLSKNSSFAEHVYDRSSQCPVVRTSVSGMDAIQPHPVSAFEPDFPVLQVDCQQNAGINPVKGCV